MRSRNAGTACGSILRQGTLRMDFGLSGKVVLISGGAAGIGLASAKLFLQEGAKVFVVDVKEPLADASLEKFGSQLRLFQGDLSLQSACEHAVQSCLQHFGRLDILVNNAGMNDATSLDASPEQFERSLQRNLLHVFALTHHARLALKSSRGAIVNVSSKVAETGQGRTSGYAAAKGAINALTREWAVALAPEGVRVNCVVPAECDTSQYQAWFQKQSNPASARESVEKLVPLENRLTTPTEVAAMILFLSSSLASHITGQIIHVDGGYTHLDRAITSGSPKWGE
ncbi:MAG: SDR family oxidoreductase [Verrucomicrobiota bacterium]|nr:SDR family oxidoreductase [Verrucomicrobiota bacterium]